MPEHNALTGSSLHDPKAHASSHADGGADAITSLETLVAAVLMKMATPYVRFIGTEGSAVDYRLVETAGSMKLQKNTGSEGTPTWADLVDIDSNGNLNAVSLKVGGTEVVNSSGDIQIASVPASALASGPINASGQLDFDTATELTIASGVITATNNYHTIDTQSDGASDDLDTITAGSNVSAGFVLVVQPANAARTVVLKNGTSGADNLDIGGDITLDESYSTYALVYDGSNWRPFSYAASVTAATISGTLGVSSGGTGATSLTDGGLLLGSGTGAITALGVATNGQIPIGDGSTDPALGTLTATANETTITNGSGTITVGLVSDPTIGLSNVTGTLAAARLPAKAEFTSSDADALEVTGGLTIGSGDVALVGVDGRINGPLSSTIIDDLSGANLTTLSGGAISSGTVAAARLGTGTPGSGNFLRGDGAWTAISAAAITEYVVAKQHAGPSTASEVDVISFTVPANTWGDGEWLYVQGFMSIKNNRGATSTFTPKTYIDGTAHTASDNTAQPDSATEQHIPFRLAFQRVGSEVWSQKNIAGDSGMSARGTSGIGIPWLGVGYGAWSGWSAGYYYQVLDTSIDFTDDSIIKFSITPEASHATTYVKIWSVQAWKIGDGSSNYS